MAKVSSILESSLYVADLKRSSEFYRDLFEFSIMACDDRFCALAAGERQVLLLFRKGACGDASPTPGGTIPGHDGTGALHIAFAIDPSDREEWEKRLQAKRIAIESRVTWPRGGQSIYFRDPDRHLVELATPGVWPIY
jgi:catechol 2,3-dioxygenase-like lactoylglutathione lyase family enzyme